MLSYFFFSGGKKESGGPLSVPSANVKFTAPAWPGQVRVTVLPLVAYVQSPDCPANVIVALWDAEDSLHRVARAALDKAFNEGTLVISGAVYAELLAAPGRTEQFLNQFCDIINMKEGERSLVFFIN